MIDSLEDAWRWSSVTDVIIAEIMETFVVIEVAVVICEMIIVSVVVATAEKATIVIIIITGSIVIQ